MRIKDSEDRDAFQRVFDARTIELLQKMLRNRKIKEIVGIISQGKEANVYFGYSGDDIPIAIKIYKVDIQSAKWMVKYIKGDPRFKKTGTSPDKIIFTWCQKEFRNLRQINRAGIKCPKPLFFDKNILVMTFIGEYNGTPALKLKDALGEIKSPLEEFDKTINYMIQMYQKAKVVHADLSEFNILYFKNEQYIIDVSQAVDSYSHPKALEFLARDLKNVFTFYKKLGIKTPDPLNVFNDIIN